MSLCFRSCLLMAFLALLTGCVTLPQSAGLSSGVGKSRDTFARDVQVLQVRIDPASQGANLQTTETSMTLAIKRYIEEAAMFRAVRLPNEAPPAQGHRLQFRFDRFSATRKVHPAYFPGALLTLTLYIWVNGPVGIDSADIHGVLTVLDAGGRPVAEFSKTLAANRNVGIYDPEYLMPSGVEERTAVVQDLLEQYAQFLKSNPPKD